MHKEITKDTLKRYAKKTNELPMNGIIQKALIKSGISAVAENNQVETDMQFTFSKEIKTGEITNQKRSGRCWMFAGMNTLRLEIMKKCNLETFELSQNYILFYDKLEKANYFYESILDTLDMGTDSRLIAWLLSSPLGDGGQWDMLCSLINKYGVVPKWIMPETFHSSATAKMVQLLTRKLRKDASVLRESAKNSKTETELRELKDEMLQEVYAILTRCLGNPPTEFDFEYKDKDEKYFRVENLTPKTFYDKYVNISLDDYVSLINAPTKDKPYNKTFTVLRLGNVVAGQKIKYLNISIEELKAAALAQLNDDKVVWFGCDVGKMLGRDCGMMDLNMYDYTSALAAEISLTKAEQLDYGDSCMTHAMVFTGVNVVNGKPNRWKVENSWGDKAGNEGWFVMSDEWFDKYMYQVVVNKKYLSKEQLSYLELEPIELKPWDPMGSLAL